MKSRWITLLLALGLGAPASAQTADTPAPPKRGGLVILDFKPAMDDLMTMLVQPRHIKLYYAGQAGNWPLAGFQLNELRGALARIGRTIPNYRQMNVDATVAAIFNDSMDQMDTAIKSSDLAAFTAAYQALTVACNGCHQAMEHPFVVIKTPGPDAFPDQAFGPR